MNRQTAVPKVQQLEGPAQLCMIAHKDEARLAGK